MYKKVLLGLGLVSAIYGSSLTDGKQQFEKKEYKKAFNTFLKTAQDGMVAKYNMAIMYQNGLGVKRDLQKAIDFYKLSATDGYKPAKEALKTIQKVIDKKQKASLSYVTIRSNVNKDSVYVDGKYVGKTKVTVPLTSNQAHKIEVRKKGYKTYKFKDVVLKPNQKKTIRAILKKEHK